MHYYNLTEKILFWPLVEIYGYIYKRKKKDMMLRMDIREITSFKGWIALKFKKKKKKKTKSQIKSSCSSYVSNLIIFSSALQSSVYSKHDHFKLNQIPDYI